MAAIRERACRFAAIIQRRFADRRIPLNAPRRPIKVCGPGRVGDGELTTLRFGGVRGCRGRDFVIPDRRQDHAVPAVARRLGISKAFLCFTAPWGGALRATAGLEFHGVFAAATPGGSSSAHNALPLAASFPRGDQMLPCPGKGQRFDLVH
jgi:hypothetical protein